MDSTAVQAIADNTAALMALTGTLWTFAGVILALVCGYLGIRYTLRG